MSTETPPNEPTLTDYEREAGFDPADCLPIEPPEETA